jgi:hypothetical protein
MYVSMFVLLLPPHARSYIVVGGVSLLQGIAFLIKHLVAPRKLGDTSYLRWSR